MPKNCNITGTVTVPDLAKSLLLYKLEEYVERAYQGVVDNEAHYHLWGVAVEHDAFVGMMEFSEAQANELQYLARQADGWWLVGDPCKVGDKPEFVEMSSWLLMYQMWLTDKAMANSEVAEAQAEKRAVQEELSRLYRLMKEANEIIDVVTESLEKLTETVHEPHS